MLHSPCTLRAGRALPSCDPMLSSGLWLATVTAHHTIVRINMLRYPSISLSPKAGLDVRAILRPGLSPLRHLHWPVSCTGPVGFLWVQPPTRHRSQKTTALDSHGFPDDVSGQRDHPIEVMVGQLVVEGKSDQTLRHGIGHR